MVNIGTLPVRVGPNCCASVRENKRAAETRISTALHPFGSQARKECVAIMVAPGIDTTKRARRSKSAEHSRMQRDRPRMGEWTNWPDKLPVTEVQQWAADAELLGIWTPFRARAFPLVGFPDSHLIEIRLDVESSVKPPYWYDLELAQIPSRAWYEWHWQRGIDPDSRRTAIPVWIRETVIDRDGDVCQICYDVVEPGDLHLDHIKPWSKGGEHSVANLRVTHSLCNMRKAARYDESGDAL